MFYPDAGARESAVAVTVVRGRTRGMWGVDTRVFRRRLAFGTDSRRAQCTHTHTLCVRSLRTSRMEVDVYHIFSGAHLLSLSGYHSVTHQRGENRQSD